MIKVKANPIENAYDGTLVTAEDGTKWLTIKYDEMYDHRDPWKWPKFMECNGMVFRWMSWNSDNHNVNYKECSKSEICKPYKKRK